MRPPVLIVGAHRSGTSATAHALALLGLRIGQRLDSHEESRAMQRLHEDYLQRAGAAWHDPARFLAWVGSETGARHCAEYLRHRVRRGFAETLGDRAHPRGWVPTLQRQFGAPWGWKEPRTTLFARAWLTVFPEARVLHVVRHPLAAARSLRTRELEFRQAGQPPIPRLDELTYCCRLTLDYVRCGEVLAELGDRFRRVRFEDLQARPAHELAELATFCGLKPSDVKLRIAAATIKPSRAEESRALDDEETARLLREEPLVERLDYRP